MTIKAPSPSQIRDLALSVGLDLEPDEIEEYGEALSDINAVFEALDALPEPLPEVKYPRTPGRFPAKEENPHNVPCGNTDDGRPIGLLLVGRHFDELTIYRAAYALENG